MRRVLSELVPASEQVFIDDSAVMVRWLKGHLSACSLISLDFDLPLRAGDDGRMQDLGDGRQVADYLAEQSPCCPLIVHSSNYHGAIGMMRVLDDAGWKPVRVYPWDDVDWVARDWAEAVRRLLG